MNIYITLIILLSMLTSLLAVCWIFFKILKIAKEKNLVDNPDARKLQKTPVPLVGGIAVFFWCSIWGPFWCVLVFPVWPISGMPRLLHGAPVADCFGHEYYALCRSY